MLSFFFLLLLLIVTSKSESESESSLGGKGLEVEAGVRAVDVEGLAVVDVDDLAVDLSEREVVAAGGGGK